MTAQIDTYAKRHPQLGGIAVIPPLLQRALRASRTDARVLDIGCGEGATLRALDTFAPHVDAIGCDLSSERVTIARSHGMEAVVADCAILPWPDAHFDLVITRHVIEHVDNEQTMLNEAARVLQPNGLLYLETPRRLRGAWYPYRNRYRKFVLDPTHLREYRAAAEVTSRFEHAGLQLVDSREARIHYELGHIIRHVIRRHRRVSDTGRRSRLAGIRIRVPRYRELQLLVRRSQSLDGVRETRRTKPPSDG